MLRIFDGQNNGIYIGVTGPDKGGTAAWLFTKFALWIQGARAYRISPSRGLPEKRMHGFIIGGGADINPKWYGGKESQDIHKSNKISGFRQFFFRVLTITFFPFLFLIRKFFSVETHAIDKERDELEFSILEKVIKKGVPVLGICRGAQLINIHLGGNLYGDISYFYTESPEIRSIWPQKKVELERDSKLKNIIGFENIFVNGLHHQAIDNIGEGLAVSAMEQNGVIQAIEHLERPFLMGVQWHPEYMPQIPAQRKIFKALVDQARIYRDSQ